MTAAHSSSHSRSQEQRKVPARRALRRTRLVASAGLVVVAAVGLTPLLLVLVGMRVDAIAFILGFAAGLGTSGLRALSNVRGQQRFLTQTGRFLTARTWTGYRTIDLRELRSVHARRIAVRFWPPLDYVVVRDSAGVRMTFCTAVDLKLIRRAIAEGQRGPSPAGGLRVSPLARAALGILPLPRGLSALWAIGSVEVPVAVMFAFIIPALVLSPR